MEQPYIHGLVFCLTGACNKYNPQTFESLDNGQKYVPVWRYTCTHKPKFAVKICERFLGILIV